MMRPAILIIEQDDPTRELYLRELSRDYQVFPCVTEREVLDTLAAREVGAIVLEPALREGLGWALMDSLRDVLAARPVPIVVCSALDERRRGMDLGAAVYLVKPVLPATLLDTLRRVVPQADAEPAG